jgi:hypothetical protein
LHAELKPTPEEIGQRRLDYLRLLLAEPNPVARLAAPTGSAVGVDVRQQLAA